MIKFFKEAKAELKKVTWLTRKQAIRISIITTIFVLASAVILWGVDTILTFLYQLLK